MFLLWSCGAGHGHTSDHDHDAHGHETEIHSHEAEPHGEHGEEAGAGHSDEIVIPEDKAAAIGIITETVTPGSFREVIHTSGEILPAAGDEAAVVATTDGTVSFAENYTEGAAVSAGQELFSIQSSNLQDGNRIEKARIAYLAAKDEYERASKLTGSRIVSQKEFASIKENYENERQRSSRLCPVQGIHQEPGSKAG